MKGRLQWFFTQTDKIYVDNQPVCVGDVCKLECGTHQIQAETERGYQNFQLEVMASASIAAMFLDTDSGSLDYIHETKENTEGGRYTLFNGQGICSATGRIESMHCRGNASWEDTDKKSYQLKLEKKTNLLGMGEAKKWLLLANAFDNTLLRDMTALEMAQNLGIAFTPETKFADIYINGEYMGNYLIAEKIEIGENRVNIRNLEEETESLNPGKALEMAEPFMEQQGRLFSTKGYLIDNEPKDISGGYLLELETSDRYGVEASGFITSRMQPVVITSPTYATSNQVSYIADRYQDFEDAVFAENGYSPYTGMHFSDYIDLDSFARKYLIEEVTKNLDAAFTSQFIYKPDDSFSTKFYAGPAWDYDKSIAGSGITQEGIDLHDARGLYAAVKTKDSDIWYALYQHEEFRQRVADIFIEEMEPIIEYQTHRGIVDNTRRNLDSAMMNAVRWNSFTESSAVEEKKALYIQKVKELVNFLNEREAYLEELWMEEEAGE